MTQARNPERYRNLALWVSIIYKNDPTLPPEQAFAISTVRLSEPTDEIFKIGGPLRGIIFNDVEYDRACEKGRMEMQDNFYAAVRYVLVVAFADSATVRPLFRINLFSVDKKVGNALLTRTDWWALLKEFVEKGAQMKLHDPDWISQASFQVIKSG
jgi:hypothetical protein